ncbi:YfcL protein [Colwellia chukchiensis]|uniref:YfcL protein n=1 Tax=Colwellia chukchiensis TaxID=641665 RepID=A0A1H7GWN4_9GAMM|nr:YfcL family protein [Colwellia chukchiensis]SEK41040.1 YfcL protein [Colwellia chukchiensis]
MQFKNLTALYDYLDQQVAQDVSADELFAGSYLRGFISLAGSEYGDESQPLTAQLAENISAKLLAARGELNPQDRQIVQNYWQQLQVAFNRQ